MFQPVIEAVPSKLEIVRSGSNFTITVPLVASEDGRRWAGVEVRLLSCSWQGVSAHEFQFVIAVFDKESDEPRDIFDRDLAAGYVDQVRSLVMPCVLKAAETLVKSVQPDVIYRATYATRPPDKSLSKHEMITDIIASIGYGVAQRGTDRYGRRFWLMIKDGDEHGQGQGR